MKKKAELHLRFDGKIQRVVAKGSDTDIALMLLDACLDMPGFESVIEMAYHSLKVPSNRKLLENPMNYSKKMPES